jgi:molecular chaperone DnaK
VDIRVLQGERPMANDNKVLGNFQLTGIPPAPRGIPQIEVTFDMDANGILHVSAVDKATGKQQSIKIERSGSLSESDIEKMVKDAEMHADEDNRKKETITAKNELDNIIFSTEKSMKEHGEKLAPEEKTKIEDALKEAREQLDKGQTKEEYEAAKNTLAEKAQKLGEILYQQYQQENPGQNPEGGEQGPQPDNQGTPDGNGPIDADFEVVDDDK